MGDYLNREDEGVSRITLDHILEKLKNDKASGLFAQGVSQLFRWSQDNSPFPAVKELMGSGMLNVSRSTCKSVALYYFVTGMGGAERVTCELADMFADKGFDVVLLCDEPIKEGVVSNRVKGVVLPPHAEVTDDYSERARRLEEALIENDIDVLIYSQWLGQTMLWDLLLAKMLGIACIVHLHGRYTIVPRYKDYRHYLMPLALNVADAVVCLNKTDCVFWRKFNPRVYQTINPARYKTEDVQASPLDGETVVWLARFDRGKAPEEALYIFRHVLDDLPNARLQIIGGGNDAYLQELEALSASLGISESVTFLGQQSDPAPYLSKATVFLITSRSEGYCLALAESKAFGLPCVMYDLPYLSLLEDSRGIVSVPQDDRVGAARAISEILSDEQLRIRLGQEAIDSARNLERFDRADFWLGIINDVLSGKPTFDEREVAEYDLWIDLCEQIYLYGQLVQFEHADELRQMKAKLEQVESSTSLKVGLALTSLPRSLKRKLKN